jgi:hypothetical protein
MQKAKMCCPTVGFAVYAAKGLDGSERPNASQMLGWFGFKSKVLLVGQKYCFEKATKSLNKTKRSALLERLLQRKGEIA